MGLLVKQWWSDGYSFPEGWYDEDTEKGRLCRINSGAMYRYVDRQNGQEDRPVFGRDALRPDAS